MVTGLGLRGDLRGSVLAVVHGYIQLLVLTGGGGWSRQGLRDQLENQVTLHS
jgi:hypothetical protein